jgi:phosphoribosylamine--glycine ligase
LLEAAALGRLAEMPPLTWHDRAAVAVVVAAEGYPSSVVTGGAITGLLECAALQDVQVLHAGTSAIQDDVVASGGRVLSIVGTGPDLATARDRAYAGVDAIHLLGSQHRTDIADRAITGKVLP